MGMPPIRGVKFSRAVITVRPLPLELMSSSKKRVGFLNMTAVLALPMEMLAPAENVPSSRSKAIKFPPSSTTAMTPPGACSFCASALRRGNDLFRSLQGERLFLDSLGIREARKTQNHSREAGATSQFRLSVHGLLTS